MAGTFIVLFLLTHSVISTFHLVDLFTVSQRQNKFQWFMMLLFVPLVGAVLYNKSKKRHKEHNA